MLRRNKYSHGRSNVDENRGYYARILYDGQTGEVLVAVSSNPKDENTVFVKDEPNSTPLHAIAKIDALMADDRNQCRDAFCAGLEERPTVQSTDRSKFVANTLPEAATPGHLNQAQMI